MLFMNPVIATILGAIFGGFIVSGGGEESGHVFSQDEILAENKLNDKKEAS